MRSNKTFLGYVGFFIRRTAGIGRSGAVEPGIQEFMLTVFKISTVSLLLQAQNSKKQV
jgi:hypothetical protein